MLVMVIFNTASEAYKHRDVRMSYSCSQALSQTFSNNSAALSVGKNDSDGLWCALSFRCHYFQNIQSILSPRRHVCR